MISKKSTIYSIFWSSVERVLNTVMQVLVTIILARLLTPKDFGIIGIVLLFSLIADAVVDGGFVHALIRKKDVTQQEYSSVFFLNIIIGFILYLMFGFSSKYVGVFFNAPEIGAIGYLFFLSIPINSFGLIQTTLLTRELKFDILAKITIVATFISGVISVLMALYGYGVWAIVAQYLTVSVIRTVLLWIISKWRPSLFLSFKLVYPLFKFGYNLVIIALLNTFFNNIYTFFIGKNYSKKDLGYYTYSNQLVTSLEMFSTSVIQRVTYPIMSQLQDDNQQLKLYYNKIIKYVMFVNFPILFCLSFISEPLFRILFSAKWVPAASIFSILCFSGSFRFLTNIGMNIFKVKGKAKELLFLDIVGKASILFLLLITMNTNMEIIILGKALSSVIIYAIYVLGIKKLINISIKEQILNIGYLFILALLLCIPLYFIVTLYAVNIGVLICSIVGYFLAYILFSKKFFPQIFDVFANIIRKALLNLNYFRIQ